MTVLTAATIAGAMSAAAGPTPAACAHVQNTLQFDVHAPMRKVAPTFAPIAEKSWGDPGWDPRFIYPQPGSDVQGAVFRVQHGEHQTVWINTVFDPGRGRMQYVYFMPGVQVVAIDVRVTEAEPSDTHVEVTYQRTALTPQANPRQRSRVAARCGDGPGPLNALSYAAPACTCSRHHLCPDSGSRYTGS